MPRAAQVMAAAIMISTFGCVNGLILAGARVFYAMARQGQMPAIFGRLSRRGVPAAGRAATEPVRTIEVIQNGQVVRQVSFDEWKRTGSLGKVRFQTSGWCLVRAMADDSHTFCFASTAPWYVEVGANRRRISKQSGQFFLDWVRERRERIKIDDPDRRAAVLKHHDDAEKYWSDLVAQANAE